MNGYLGLLKLLFGKMQGCTISIMTLPDKQIQASPRSNIGQKLFMKRPPSLERTTNTYFSVLASPGRYTNGIRGGSEDAVYATACLPIMT